jgi:1,4-dihydroxy-2-naphthoate octaprenyltransferase
VVAGLGPGLLASGLLVVNNLRDIDEDREAEKRTLAVRFGQTFGRFQYTICIVGSALVPIVFVVFHAGPLNWGPAVASLVIIPGLAVVLKVWRNHGIGLRPCLGMTAGLLAVFTVLFCLGLGR